jgi:hypothetical protein
MNKTKEAQRSDLIDQLCALQREYHTRAEPIIMELARLTTPAPIVMPDGSTMKYIGPGSEDDRD